MTSMSILYALRCCGLPHVTPRPAPIDQPAPCCANAAGACAPMDLDEASLAEEEAEGEAEAEDSEPDGE